MTIEEIYREHLDKEPRKYKKGYEKLKFKTTAYIGWQVIKANIEQVVRIEKEKRQQILDRFKKGGITIKKVADLFHENSNAVGQLIYYNIDSRSFLRSETV